MYNVWCRLVCPLKMKLTFSSVLSFTHNYARTPMILMPDGKCHYVLHQFQVELWLSLLFNVQYNKKNKRFKTSSCLAEAMDTVQSPIGWTDGRHCQNFLFCLSFHYAWLLLATKCHLFYFSSKTTQLIACFGWLPPPTLVIRPKSYLAQSNTYLDLERITLIHYYMFYSSIVYSLFVIRNHDSATKEFILTGKTDNYYWVTQKISTSW